jgi:NAD(P)-dependent dehydrogenase (short-subunit alcohol dehydrogenase family)
LVDEHDSARAQPRPADDAAGLCSGETGERDVISMRVAIVTGGGRGLGRAEAVHFASAGYAVVVNDLGADVAGQGRDNSVAEGVVNEILRSGGSAVAHCGDVASEADVADLLDVALTAFGRVDCLINNAGNLPTARILPDMTLAEFDVTMRVHVRGHFCMSIALTNHWREQAKRRGRQVRASIVNTASDAYLLGAPWRPDYASAKAAIIALTVGTAMTCSHFGVRVNAVLPRANTRMTESLRRGRPHLAPEQVAPVIVALCGQRAERINGQVLVASPGLIGVVAGPRVSDELTWPDEWTLGDVEGLLGSYFDQDRASYGAPLGESARNLEELHERFDLFRAVGL